LIFQQSSSIIKNTAKRFNGKDIEDIDFDLDNFDQKVKIKGEAEKNNLKCQKQLSQSYPQPKVNIKFVVTMLIFLKVEI
jgi:hypothetical protein